MNPQTWIETFRESLEGSLGLIAAFLPKLLGAVLLMLAGYLLARMVGLGSAALLKIVGFNRLLA
ncbi:membrane protein, partial [Petrachloros mirabilis]